MAGLPTLPKADRPWVIPLVCSRDCVHTLVDVKVLGKKSPEVTMVVDTGARFTSLPLWAVRRAGSTIVKRTFAVEIRDVSGTVRTRHVARIKGLQIGPLKIRNATVSVNMNSAMTVGVLGDDLLRQRPFLIDREAGRLVLGAPPMKDPDLEFRLERDAPGITLVKVLIAKKPHLLVLDTGAVMSGLDDETGKDMKLRVRPLGREVEIKGAYGSYKIVGCFQVNTQWGSLKFPRLHFLPLPDFKVPVGIITNHAVGLWGMDILRQFTVRVDLQKELLHLKHRRPRES